MMLWRITSIGAKARSQAGFSLAEVLAALFLTTLLVVTLSPFTSQILHTWARGSDVSRFVEITSRGFNVIRADLRQTVVWNGFGMTENLHLFRGDQTSLVFPAATGLGRGRNGLELISLSVEESGEGRALVRRRAQLVGTAHTAFADPAVLISGPYAFALSYYDDADKPRPIWRTRGQLPSRVAIRITSARNPEYNGTFFFSLFATASAGCFANHGFEGCPTVFSSATSDKELLKQLNIEVE